MGRSPCCLKEEMIRGAWTAQEDKILREYIRAHGEGKWRNLPMKAGLKRCGKSCRLRWLNYLRPDIKRGNISPDEEELIIRLHKLLGNRWSLIAGRLPGRTDNEIKNYWNTNLGKKVQNNEQIYDPGITQKSKSSDLQNNKIIKNTNSTKKFPQPTAKVLEPSSPAVKTKALKCSKVIIDPSPQKIENVGSQQVTKTNTLAPLQPLDGDHDSSNQMAKNTSSSASCGSKVDDASDLIMDLDVGDFCVSDLLDSQGNNLGDVCNNNNNNTDECSPSSDHQAIIFSGETLQDYCRNLSDCVALLEESNGFQSISSFLFDAQGEDWLGNYPSL